MARVSLAALRERLQGAGELALVDIREPGEFQHGHLLLASNMPLSRLELMAGRLLPRRGVPIVLCAGDPGDPRLEGAQEVFRGLGYRQVQVLDGGIADWPRHGFEVFTGFNVPSKAYGEWLEMARHTPSMDAQTLHLRIREGAVDVIDCRPGDEHARGAVPGARNLAGVELVRHFAARAGADARRPIVVHCAGRTRGIVAAQSLIDLGSDGSVSVLENGLIGWQLSGYELAPPSHPDAAPLPASDETARSRARERAQRLGVPLLDEAGYARLEAESGERSLFRFDVRTVEEHQAGHRAGFVHVPGGQLLQSLDDHVGVLGARIVLFDPGLVRAVATAAYLREMGRREVFVLGGDGTSTGEEPAPSGAIEHRGRDNREVSQEQAQALLRAGARVVDLGDSRRYRRMHLPGAAFAVRSLLHRYANRLAGTQSLLLTCNDGRLSALAAAEFEQRLRRPVYALAGGVEAWSRAGLPVDGEAELLSEMVDVATTPYDYTDDVRARMQAYIDWELGLMAQVERDGVLRFGNPAASANP